MFLALGLKKFVQFVTGAPVPLSKSIQLHFDEEPNGAILASTCGCKLVLPRKTFKCYKDVKVALDSVMVDLSFNVV